MGGLCTKRQGSEGERLGVSAETLLNRMTEPVVVAPSQSSQQVRCTVHLYSV